MVAFPFFPIRDTKRSYFLNRLGTVAAVGIWCSGGAEDVSADARVPLERASGSISRHAHYVPFQSTKWDQLFPVIQAGHRSVLACQVRVCFSCRQGFGVASGQQGQSDPVAAPPWRRRWCKSGEDVWGNLLLHVCQKDSVVSSFNPSFVSKISCKECPGCLILKFLFITLTSEVSLLFF